MLVLVILRWTRVQQVFAVAAKLVSQSHLIPDTHGSVLSKFDIHHVNAPSELGLDSPSYKMWLYAHRRLSQSDSLVRRARHLDLLRFL